MHGDAPPLGTRLTIEAVDELPVNRQSSDSTPGLPPGGLFRDTEQR
jgi:hypothetical protein